MKDENFSQYENHIDSLISQYKTQLESIKTSRQNKFNGNSNSFVCADLNNINNLNSIRPSESQSSKITLISKQIKHVEESPINNRASTSKFIDESYSIVSQKNTSPNNSPKNSKIIKNAGKVTSSVSLQNKLNYVNEENEKLQEKINELSKELETKEEINKKCENLQNEVKKLNSIESALKEEIEKRQNQYDTEIEKIKNRLQDLDNYYDGVVKSKDHEIEILNNKIILLTERIENDSNHVPIHDHIHSHNEENFLENENKNKIIQLLTIFFKRNFKYLDQEVTSTTGNYIQPDWSALEIKDFECTFISFEKFIHKLLKDNTDLLRHLNENKEQISFRENNPKIKKLNQAIEDLKVENNLLKNQMNNLLESQKKAVENKKSKKVNYSFTESGGDTKNRVNYANNLDSENENSEKKIKKKNKKKKEKENNRSIDHIIPKRPIIKPIKNDQENISTSIPVSRTMKEQSRNNEIKTLSVQPSFSSRINLNTIQQVTQTTNIEKESDSINTELKQLEKLKSKIKDLENKIGEINKDEKEKKIIDSLREFRNRNMSPISNNVNN
jgi:hypothetical protein